MKFSLTAALVGVAVLASSVAADIYGLNLDDTTFLFVDHLTGLFNGPRY